MTRPNNRQEEIVARFFAQEITLEEAEEELEDLVNLGEIELSEALWASEVMKGERNSSGEIEGEQRP